MLKKEHRLNELTCVFWISASLKVAVRGKNAQLVVCKDNLLGALTKLTERNEQLILERQKPKKDVEKESKLEAENAALRRTVQKQGDDLNQLEQKLAQLEYSMKGISCFHSYHICALLKCWELSILKKFSFVSDEYLYFQWEKGLQQKGRWKKLRQTQGLQQRGSRLTFKILEQKLPGQRCALTVPKIHLSSHGIHIYMFLP